MPAITIQAADGGTFGAYMAVPSAGRGPGIVVAQEIFGVNQVMRDLCDDLAGLGYVAVCPDLFWRQQPGIELTDKTDAEWGRAFELYQGFDEAKGVEDLRSTLDDLRRRDECAGRVGAVGYCLGGKLAYLMATRTDVDCSVGYYGVGIEKALDEADRIARPLMLHIAEQDRFCPPEARQAILDRLDSLPNVTAHVYPGVDHAFARVGGAHYDADAAETANRRSRAFLETHLG